MFAFFLSDLHQTCLTFDREFVLKETLTVKYIYIREEIHKNEKQWQAVHERLYGSHSVSWIVHLDLKSHIIKSTSEPYYREMSSWKWQRTRTNNNNNNNRCWWTAGPDSTLTVSDEQWQMSNTETIKKKETWNCSRETRCFHVSEQGARRESHPASLCDSSTQQHTAIHSNTQQYTVIHKVSVSVTRCVYPSQHDDEGRQKKKHTAAVAAASTFIDSETSHGLLSVLCVQTNPWFHQTNNKILTEHYR